MRRQLMKAFLIIDPVMEEDSGTYLCRVDFKWARTVNTVTNLTVIGEFYSDLLKKNPLSTT